MLNSKRPTKLRTRSGTVYQEGTKSHPSIFAHNNKRYDLNKIFKIIHNKPIKRFPVKDFIWMLKFVKNTPDDIKRINQADLSYPIIVTKRNNKLVIVDGMHRLQKFIKIWEEKKKESISKNKKYLGLLRYNMNGYYITSKELESALIRTSAKPNTGGRVGVHKNPRDETLLKQISIEKENINLYGEKFIIYKVILNNEIIGKAWYQKPKNYIQAVNILPEYQKRGVATLLYDYIEHDQNIKLVSNASSKEGKLFWAARSVRKNPRNLLPQQILDIISNNSDIQNLNRINSGHEAIVYFIHIIKHTYIFDKLIKKGEYAVKIYHYGRYLSEKQQKYLILLSKYGLIPEIFYIDSNVIIMKYINGISLNKFHDKLEYAPEIIDKLMKKYLQLTSIWKKLGFEHGDIAFSPREENILVTEDLKLYVIDPFRGLP